MKSNGKFRSDSNFLLLHHDSYNFKVKHYKTVTVPLLIIAKWEKFAVGLVFILLSFIFQLNT